MTENEGLPSWWHLPEDFKEVRDSLIVEGGLRYQLGICTEELAEMIQALSKVQRNPDDPKKRENVINELGDVYFTLSQVVEILSIQSYEAQEALLKSVTRARNYISGNRTKED